MGQYYYPVSLDKKEYLLSHDYDNGLKLMEHSYIGNNFMNAIERLLIPGGAWYKTKILWAGDYADHEPGYAKTKDGYDVNIYSIIYKEGTKIKPSDERVDVKYHYLTNHTKKVVIDLNKIKEDGDGWKIHPLSLLTCEGNGRGGGDFHGEDSKIGSWARNVISLEESVLPGYELCDDEDGQFVEEGYSNPVFVQKDGNSALKPDLILGNK